MKTESALFKEKVQYLTALIGVRFDRIGKLSYCDSGDLNVGPGDRVIVETSNGHQIAWVVIGSGQIVYSEVEGPLLHVVRKALEEDVSAHPI